MRGVQANVGQLANIEKYAKSVAAGLLADLLSHVSTSCIHVYSLIIMV